jgi:hypothetical protein
MLRFGLKDGWQVWRKFGGSDAKDIRRWLSVILLLNRLLFRVKRENVCSHIYVEPNRLIILFAWCVIIGNLAFSKSGSWKP